MTGALALAGIDPDITPLHRWCAAVWAVWVQFMGMNVPLESVEKAWAPFHAEPEDHGSPDRETWGALPEHVAGTQRLMEGPG